MQNNQTVKKKKAAKIKLADYTQLFIKIGIIICFSFILLYFAPSSLIEKMPNIYEIEGSNGRAVIPADKQFEDSMFQLAGEWEYYPNLLLEPQDFIDNAHEINYISYPHFWENEAENYPNNIGYATYRMVLETGKAVNSAGLYSRFQFGAYRIYLNGEEITNTGGVSENFSDYHINYANSMGYIMPINTDKLEIIVQIQNKDHEAAGFSMPVLVGSGDATRYYRTLLVSFSGIVAGFLLCLFVYSIMVFLQDRSRKTYLDFALVLLCCLYATVASTEEVLVYYSVPLVSGEILFKLEYISVLVAAFFANAHIYKHYIKNKLFTRIFAVWTLVISAVVLIGEPLLISSLRFVIHGSAILMFIVNIIIIIIAFIFGKDKSIVSKKTAAIEFFSILILCAGILVSKLEFFLWASFDVFPIFAAFFAFIQFYVLLRHYSDVEQNLRQLTKDLEIRVEERTAQLVEMNSQVQAASEAKGAFLARMSHEIRTPMNAIIGMSDLIDTDNFDDIQRRYFRDIKATSHSLLNIINDILDFSKIESKKFDIINNHFNVYTMMDNICSVSTFSAKSKGLAFIGLVEDNLPSVLYGDDVRYKQVITNLVSNAIKYTRDGYVKLLAYAMDNWFVISVEDSGIGIQEEDLPRVFESFEQVDRFNNHSVVGTGLGLAISKQIVDMVGGKIEVTSVYGEGTTFTVYFPLVEGDPSQIVFIQTDSSVMADDANVLVVDDNSINLTVAMGVLAKHNIHPDTAQSGFEAIEKIKNKDYDLIFMDHMMPEMDGIETTEHIREMGGKYSKVPIVALTANAVAGAKELMIFKGMNDFLTKPIDKNLLNQALSKWLPKEKIRMEKNKQKKSEMDNIPLYDVMNSASEISGDIPHWMSLLTFLDFKSAISKIGGDAKLYEQILGQFNREISEYISTLNKTLARHDLKNYAITVHGVKSVLRNIGADKPAIEAAFLEKAAKNGEVDLCSAKNNAFCEKLLILSQSIASVLPSKSENRNKSEKDEAFLSEILKKLHFSCMIGDSSSVDEEIENLGEYNYGEHNEIVEKIIIAATDMEYEKVMQYCDDILIGL